RKFLLEPRAVALLERGEGAELGAMLEQVDAPGDEDHRLARPLAHELDRQNRLLPAGGRDPGRNRQIEGKSLLAGDDAYVLHRRAEIHRHPLGEERERRPRVPGHAPMLSDVAMDSPRRALVTGASGGLGAALRAKA